MFSVKINDIKKFANYIFVDDVFNDFYLVEGTVSTFATFFIDGKTNKDFYDDTDNLTEFSKWSTLKPYFYSFIKGKHLPLSFKIILECCDHSKDDFAQNSDSSFLLNIRYISGTLTITTGYSCKSFSLNREPAKQWDEHVKVFLKTLDCDMEYDF